MLLAVTPHACREPPLWLILTTHLNHMMEGWAAWPSKSSDMRTIWYYNTTSKWMEMIPLLFLLLVWLALHWLLDIFYALRYIVTRVPGIDGNQGLEYKAMSSLWVLWFLLNWEVNVKFMISNWFMELHFTFSWHPCIFAASILSYVQKVIYVVSI